MIGAEVDAASKRPLDFNPCMSCKLCVAACPVGAIKPRWLFRLLVLLQPQLPAVHGRLRQLPVEDVAASRSIGSTTGRSRATPKPSAAGRASPDGPNYNAAHCLAVCPAGEDVIGVYRRDKVQHRKDVLDPLVARSEPVYVVKGGDAEDHVRNRFPHKRLRYVLSSARATTVPGFLFGMRLAFQPGKAKDLDAVYHFDFTGRQAAKATVTIRSRKLQVEEGLHGTSNLAVTVDGESLDSFPRQGNRPSWSVVDSPSEAKGAATTAVGVWEMLSGLARSALCQQFANVSNSSTRAERASAAIVGLVHRS